MKKGFTLIELLAVILILGIIALILTPMIKERVESKAKVVCNYNNYPVTYYVDTILSNTENSIIFISEKKEYEVSKVNCYLVIENN